MILYVTMLRAFVGHSVDGHPAAYPYESVHPSEKWPMMQKARAGVLSVCRASKLKRDAGWCESEDHIAVELEFMRVMWLRTAEALEKGDEDAAVEALRAQHALVRRVRRGMPLVRPIVSESGAVLFRAFRPRATVWNG